MAEKLEHSYQNSEIEGYSYTGLISSYSLGGRFNNISFDNVKYHFDGSYFAFVSGGYSIGDTISDVTVVNSMALANDVGLVTIVVSSLLKLLIRLLKI